MKKKIIELLNIEGRKKIIENFFSLSLLKAATMLLPLILIPHFIKTLGLDVVGLLAVISAICAYFNTLIDYGFSYTGTREIALNKGSNYKITQILIDITICKLFLISISFSILVLLYFINTFIKDNFLIVLFSFLFVALSSLAPSWFFQGLEDMRKIATGEVLGKLLSFILIIFFINKESEYFFIPLFYVCGQLFSLVVYFIYIKKYIVLEGVVFIGGRGVLMRLKNDWNMFLNILFPNFYNVYSYLVLGYFSTMAQVAIYDIIRKIMNVSEQALGIISKVYYPILANNIERFNEYRNFILIFSIGLLLVQFLFGVFGVSYFFYEDIDLIRNMVFIQSLSPLIYGLMIAYGINLLGVLSEDKVLRNITIISSIIGFFLVSILTFFYMAVGALVGILLTWLTRLVLCYCKSKEIIKG